MPSITRRWKPACPCSPATCRPPTPAPVTLRCLPSNVRGSQPPAGTPNYFVSEDRVGFFWDVFKFHVDFAVPANTSLSARQSR